MKKKPVKRSSILYGAVMWTLASAAWTVTLVMRLSHGESSEGLTVITALTAALSVVNSVISWIRYVRFEDETEVC